MCTPLRRAAILGIGSSVPSRVLTNADLEKMVDTTHQWIMERTGIRERRIADSGTATSDLCLEAARTALERAGIKAGDLGMILVGTATPDMVFPATAHLIQHRLGTRGQMAFDFQAACSGFLYGLSIADKYIASGACDYALVCGAETLSRIVNWKDRSTCVLFGDGAGAAVVGPSPDGRRGILSTVAEADGAHSEMLHLPAGGSRRPASHATVDSGGHYLHMTGNEVFKIAVRSLISVAKSAMARAGVGADDIDLFVPHQANLRIIEAVGKRLGVSDARVFVNLDKYGNTSAASIPIALDEAQSDGRLKAGDLVLLDAFGAGATSAAACLRW